MPKQFLIPALLLAAFGLGCQTITNLVTTPAPTREPSPTEEIFVPEPTPSGSDTPQEFAVPDEGRSHIEVGETAQYDHFPPSSGLHYGTILNWGYYNEEVPPELWVHSLEHGGIVILFNCPDGCSDTEDLLWELLETAPPEDVFNEVKILVSPNAQIETKLVALAWGFQLDLDEVDNDLLLDFYNRYVNQGPELAP